MLNIFLRNTPLITLADIVLSKNFGVVPSDRVGSKKERVRMAVEAMTRYYGIPKQARCAECKAFLSDTKPHTHLRRLRDPRCRCFVSAKGTHWCPKQLCRQMHCVPV